MHVAPARLVPDDAVDRFELTQAQCLALLSLLRKEAGEVRLDGTDGRVFVSVPRGRCRVERFELHPDGEPSGRVSSVRRSPLMRAALPLCFTVVVALWLIGLGLALSWVAPFDLG